MTKEKPFPRTLAIGAAVVVLGAVAGAWWWSSLAHAPAPARTRVHIPKIDVHVHLGPSTVGTARAVLDANGIEVALNASGGEPDGPGFDRSIEIARTSRGHVLFYCNPDLTRVYEADWPTYVRNALGRCKRSGGVGVKIFKSLGLGIINDDGSLLAVDDPRLDILFETAGQLGLPVLIHSGDPKAFFRPSSPDNERYDELSVHPHWSFYGERHARDGSVLGTWPSWEEVFHQYERRVARHPHTVFVGAHFGNDPEDPDTVGRMLARYPQLYVDTAARVPEIGRRDPRHMHDFFTRWQDRILYGSDLQVVPDGLVLGSAGRDPGTPEQAHVFFDLQWRYFETAQRRIPSPTPIQGRWTIDGIDLERSVLEKLYWRNAARVFRISLPRSAQPPRDAGSE